MKIPMDFDQHEGCNKDELLYWEADNYAGF